MQTNEESYKELWFIYGAFSLLRARQLRSCVKVQGSSRDDLGFEVYLISRSLVIRPGDGETLSIHPILAKCMALCLTYPIA